METPMQTTTTTYIPDITPRLPLYRIQHMDGGDIVTTYMRVVATDEGAVQGFIADWGRGAGAYICAGPDVRQFMAIPRDDVIDMVSVRATTSGIVR